MSARISGPLSLARSKPYLGGLKGNSILYCAVLGETTHKHEEGRAVVKDSSSNPIGKIDDVKTGWTG